MDSGAISKRGVAGENSLWRTEAYAPAIQNNILAC